MSSRIMFKCFGTKSRPRGDSERLKIIKYTLNGVHFPKVNVGYMVHPERRQIFSEHLTNGGCQVFLFGEGRGFGRLRPNRSPQTHLFCLFPYGGVPSHEITTKNQFCFVSLIRLLVKFVVLKSHSQSICVLNQCHIKINTHLVSHIETFCLPL